MDPGLYWSPGPSLSFFPSSHSSSMNIYPLAWAAFAPAVFLQEFLLLPPPSAARGRGEGEAALFISNPPILDGE